MASISVRLSDEDIVLIKKYAELNNITMSDLVRKTILEKIEDEYDLKTYEKAVTEFKKNPVTYTLDEVERDLGLS